MKDLLNPKTLCAVSYGGGVLDVQIVVGGRDLPEAVRDFRHDDPQFMELLRMAEDARDTIAGKLQEMQLLLRPDIQQQIRDNRAGVESMFGGLAIYVEEIPNEYSQQPYHRIFPWFIVTSAIGPVKIGPRSSVIEINWEKSAVKKTASELFPKEDVTKGTHYIHAHGRADAVRYVRTLINAHAF